MKVNVYDDNLEIIAIVERNENLDRWTGAGYASGEPGVHEGVSQLGDGQFVLIHSTDFVERRDWAEIISPEQAFQKIVGSGNPDLLEDFPELQKFMKNLIHGDNNE